MTPLFKYDRDDPYYYGMSVREFIFNCDSATLPAWLESYGDSGFAVTHPGFTSDAGRLKVAPALGAGNAAGIRTAFDIDTSQFTEVQWVVDGIVFDDSVGGDKVSTAVFRVTLGDASTHGLRKANNSSRDTLTVYPAAARDIDYSLLEFSDKSQGAGLIVRPLTAEGFLTNGDTKYGAIPVVRRADVLSGVGRASVEIQNSNSAQHSMHISKITLRLIAP